MKRKNGIGRWLIPGLGLKRWAILAGGALGLILVGIWSMVNTRAAKDATYALVRFLQTHMPDLSFVQGLIFVLVGLGLMVFAGVRMASQVMTKSRGGSGLDAYYENTSLANGPKVVVIGGGTGLSVLLKGLKLHTSNITAAVTVGDDGGSSGRLREAFGVIPVGDIRACIVALADEEDIMEQLFNYRFAEGEGLKGHSLGNLLLVALSAVKGSFQEAVADVDQILQMHGRVLPITNQPLTLQARLLGGDIIVGESNIPMAESPIAELSIWPKEAKATADVLAAIADADAIILGPGSLYTSIIPNLCVAGVVEAIHRTKAPVLYICNVMTQPGETTGYSAGDHLEAILHHSRKGFVDYVIADNGETMSDITLADFIMQSSSRVDLDDEKVQSLGASLEVGAIVEETDPYRHDSKKLADKVFQVLYRDNKYRSKRGPIQSFWDRQS